MSNRRHRRSAANGRRNSVGRGLFLEIEIDRLIQLPDSLILDILDRVGMKEAAETAALSLSYGDKEIDEIRRFAARVHAALAVRSGGRPALNSLVISFYYHDRFASDVDSWLDFAAKIKVKKLTLALKRDYYDMNSSVHTYSLPPIIYSNSFVTELRLEHCRIASWPQTTTVEWRCLTWLSLVYVELPQLVIGEIVSGCPVLETLDLDGCYGFDRLEIGGRSFRRLQVKFIYGEERLLEIKAPYIRDLKMEMNSLTLVRKVRLREVPSLEKADINLSPMSWNNSISEEVMPYAMELFQDLCHVKKLRLSRDCTLIVSLMATNCWQLPQLKVEYLQMDAANDVHSINGVIALVESCPYLERFHLFARTPEVDCIKWGPFARGDLTCDLIHLKTVRIEYFSYSEFHAKLARMLLKRAPFLEIKYSDLLKERLLHYKKLVQKSLLKISP